MRQMRPRALVLACSLAVLCAAQPAHAADPGRWIVTGTSSVPATYRQGLANDGQSLFFSGSFEGLTRTSLTLKQQAQNPNAIPPDVKQREQYNHQGDIAWDSAEGGRLLLPWESNAPFQPDTNPSKTGSIGVADPATLKLRYYVKLDPAEIAKAMWIATDTHGLFWTIANADLLAYRLSDVGPANAAPNGPVIHSVLRFPGVAPDGAGGAAYLAGRLYMSTQSNGTERIFSVDTTTGAVQPEVERAGTDEPEGLDIGPYLGGILHWEMVPGGGLSNAEVVNLLPMGAPLRLKVTPRVRASKATKVRATVVAAAMGFRVPLAGVGVKLGGKSAKTDAAGHATLKVKLTRGSYRAQAFYKGLRTASARVRAI
jgi:hypothetical protein